MAEDDAKRTGLVEGDPIPEEAPLLPTSELVPFPSVVMSLYVSAPKSIEAVENALELDRVVCAVAQAEEIEGDPEPEDLYGVGVACNVIRTLKLPDGRYKVLIQGVARVKITKFSSEDPFYQVKMEEIEVNDDLTLTAETEVLINRIHEGVRVLVENEFFPEELLVVTESIDEPGVLADVIAAHSRLEIDKGQQFLEETDPFERLKLAEELVTESLNQYFLAETLRNQAREELSKDQRDYFLREQLKVIRRELGESDATVEELDELRDALQAAQLPEHALKESEKQLARLQRMPSESSEYALIRTYLEWISDLPWSKKTRERVNLKKAQSILDEDHYGLEKVKDRILEYLSVRKLKRDPKGPILCFVGPPGVGKTSLGKSIARAINRKFVRISIGGVRDEAEIRGHRRTYVGALPGRIIQGIKQAESRNPVFVLDELDKVGADFRGDPSSALLEVLDPQQNNEFQDHYLNLPFDLSQVLFIATANTVDTIPEALLDRLEVIRISGYTVAEKIQIATRYLVPRQRERNGLSKLKFNFPENSIQFLIERYTREAGVRNLEREIGSLFRKIARLHAEKKKVPTSLTEKFLKESLGVTRYDPELDEKKAIVGLVRGLAWTTAGGEILPVEASVAKGKGDLILTGRLGEVMQESGKAAVFYARSNAEKLGLDPDFYQKLDLHIHVPGGATPKDGPSAGIAIVTALVSALSGKVVDDDVAMTGEITLRGNVMPVGGLKEKALAALRYGISRVVIPYQNIKDLEEIPKEQRERLKFIPVRHIGEVLELSLSEVKGKGRGRSKSKSTPARKKSSEKSASL